MREIIKLKRGTTSCCPGHDTFPDDVYSNNRSKRARSRDIKLEHQTVRAIHKRDLIREINDL